MLDFSIDYIPIFVVAGLFALLLAVLISRQKSVSGSHFLGIVFFLLGTWILMSAFEGSSDQLATKIVWAKIQYFPTQNVLPFLILFVLTYTGRIRPPYPRWIYTLWILPAVITGLALTNEWHHLIWTGFSPIDPITRLMVYYHGWGWWLMQAWFVVMLMTMLAILIVEITKSTHQRYKWQLRLMILSILGPSIGGIVYISNSNPVPGLDWGSVGSMFAILMMTASLFGFKFLDIVPVARELLLEQMEVGVLVINANQHIVDLNPAMKRLFPNREIRLGMDSLEILQNLGVKDPQFEGDGKIFRQEIISTQDSYYCIEFRLSEIRNNNRFIGWLGEFRNISFQKRGAEEKEKVNQDLSEKLLEIQTLQQELREQAIRDPLTNLFNRRFFDESFSRELAVAKRNNHIINLMMVDIDHFKVVNDQFGHPVGDHVLRYFGDLLINLTRKSDIICRYGGEEFILLISDMPTEEAQQRADTIRTEFENMCLNDPVLKRSVTISVGISAYPANGENANTLIRKADEALYEAKQAGRNCVRLAKTKLTISGST